MRGGICVLAMWAVGCSGSDVPPSSNESEPSGIAAETLTAFDAAVDPLREALDVPGVAVAIVKNGKTVFAKGYGWRDVESGAPVTTDTVFRIGSITKSFSSAIVATLVDDGALRFDTLAKDIDPSFRLPTAELTDQMTIHELLGMGTGLAGPSGFWWDYPPSRSKHPSIPMRSQPFWVIGATRSASSSTTPRTSSSSSCLGAAAVWCGRTSSSRGTASIFWQGAARRKCAASNYGQGADRALGCESEHRRDYLGARALTLSGLARSFDSSYALQLDETAGSRELEVSGTALLTCASQTEFPIANHRSRTSK